MVTAAKRYHSVDLESLVILWLGYLYDFSPFLLNSSSSSHPLALPIRSYSVRALVVQGSVG